MLLVTTHKRQLQSSDKRPTPSFHVCLETGTGSVGLFLSHVSHKAWCRWIRGQRGSNTNYVREYILKAKALETKIDAGNNKQMLYSFLSPLRAKVLQGQRDQLAGSKNKARILAETQNLVVSCRGRGRPPIARHQERAREKGTNRLRVGPRHSIQH
jgi:hypothetical protein